MTHTLGVEVMRQGPRNYALVSLFTSIVSGEDVRAIHIRESTDCSEYAVTVLPGFGDGGLGY